MTWWRGLASAAAVSGIAGCSCAVQSDVDAGDAAAPSIDIGIDASDTRSSRDVYAPRDFGPVDFGGADDGVCRPGPGLCNTDEDCVAWGAAVGPAGTTVDSICSGYRCTLGTSACSTLPGGTRQICLCGSVGCMQDEICVSDTPGGVVRCALECVGR